MLLVDARSADELETARGPTGFGKVPGETDCGVTIGGQLNGPGMDNVSLVRAGIGNPEAGGTNEEGFVGC